MTPPNWDATPSPASPPDAEPTQQARGATRELGPRSFELKLEPGAGNTLQRAVRRSSLSRTRSTSASKRSKIPRTTEVAEEEKPVGFERRHIAEILEEAKKQDGSLTLGMLNDNMMEVLSTFLEDDDTVTERQKSLEQASTLFTLEQHKSTWSSYGHHAGVYRKWCAKKGWTFDYMERVCVSWHEHCHVPGDHSPRAAMHLSPATIEQYRLERKDTLRMRLAVQALLALYKHGPSNAQHFRERRLRMLESTFGQDVEPRRTEFVHCMPNTPAAELGNSSQEAGRCRRCGSLHHVSVHCNVTYACGRVQQACLRHVQNDGASDNRLPAMPHMLHVGSYV